MCLIVFGYKIDEKFDLVFASNRDEFYGRPTQSARLWNDHSGIIGGKDLEKGGTWLGLNMAGKFASVTNYREPGRSDSGAKSRGEIVKSFLTSPRQPHEFIERLSKTANRYNGFNLIAGNRSELYHFSNREGVINKLEPGIYGLSNGLLNEPWPKVSDAKQKFQSLSAKNNFSDKNLFRLLSSANTYPQNKLPETGLPVKKEKAVSSIFVSTNEYGTRSSGLIYMNHKKIRYVERSYKTGYADVNSDIVHTIIC